MKIFKKVFTWIFKKHILRWTEDSKVKFESYIHVKSQIFDSVLYLNNTVYFYFLSKSFMWFNLFKFRHLSNKWVY
jgi:hypothetical protein